MGNAHEPAAPGRVDLGALVARVTPADLLIGATLLMLLVFSCADAWMHPEYPDGRSTTLETMWNGLGLLAALFLVAAIVYWVTAILFADLWHVPQPADPARLWLIFGGVETALIVLFYVTESMKDWDQSGSGRSSLSLAPTVTPGWAWYCGVASAGLIAVGGVLKMVEPPRTRRVAPPPQPAPATEHSYTPLPPMPSRPEAADPDKRW
jgi:hypothetical protein